MSMIKLNLTIEQIDLVLTALGDQPFVKVAELVGIIRNQALPQYEAMKQQQSGAPFDAPGLPIKDGPPLEE